MLSASCDQRHQEEKRCHLAAMWGRSATEQSGATDSLKSAEILGDSVALRAGRLVAQRRLDRVFTGHRPSASEILT
jgi:hypothetical protein